MREALVGVLRTGDKQPRLAASLMGTLTGTPHLCLYRLLIDMLLCSSTSSRPAHKEQTLQRRGREGYAEYAE